MKELWYTDIMFSCLTRPLLTAGKKGEKSDRLELAIQACLDIMQSRQQSIYHMFLIKEVTW